MRGVGRRVVMKRPDHDVSVQTCEADEEGSHALVLKARRVDSDFVESQVVRLAGNVLRRERAIDERGVRGEEPHVIDRLEVTLSFDAVSDLNGSEAPRVGNYVIGRAVRGRTEEVTRTAGGALCRESFGRVGVAV